MLDPMRGTTVGTPPDLEKITKPQQFERISKYVHSSFRDITLLTVRPVALRNGYGCSIFVPSQTHLLLDFDIYSHLVYVLT